MRSLWLYLRNVASSEVADHLHSRITNAADRLRSRPYVGRSREEFRQGLRSLRVEAYAIYYLVRDDAVIIVRVLHERRNLGKVLREK